MRSNSACSCDRWEYALKARPWQLGQEATRLFLDQWGCNTLELYLLYRTRCTKNLRRPVKTTDCILLHLLLSIVRWNISPNKPLARVASLLAFRLSWMLSQPHVSASLSRFWITSSHSNYFRNNYANEWSLYFYPYASLLLAVQGSFPSGQQRTAILCRCWGQSGTTYIRCHGFHNLSWTTRNSLLWNVRIFFHWKSGLIIPSIRYCNHLEDKQQSISTLLLPSSLPFQKGTRPSTWYYENYWTA